MIPILYEKDEVAFASNGLGRLRDCISAVCSEERNGLFELDFEYPVDGAHYDLIQIGRIVCVTHDDSNDIQPFDIVSYTKPIDGVVTFHCVHISYRQSYLTFTASNKNSLADAFTALGTSTPSNPFTYWTNKTSTGYVGCMDGTPRTVRQALGGIEGSILDAYGGEYEWDRWTVKLWSARGQYRDFSIRYGVNMLTYDEECDSSGCYSSCIPYWTDGTTTIVGDKQTSGGVTPAGREQCIPLDVSEKFEEQPTKAQVEAMGVQVMSSASPTIPSQNIKVSFVRLQDMGYSEYNNLLECRLCDTINVIFPDFNSSSTFKIVKTVWNVLTGRYDEMELGDLSISLSEALGISSTAEKAHADPEDYVTEEGTSGNWTYRKWNSGKAECWQLFSAGSKAMTSQDGSAYYAAQTTYNFPTSFFKSGTTPVLNVSAHLSGSLGGFMMDYLDNTAFKGYYWATKSITKTCYLNAYAIGLWK